MAQLLRAQAVAAITDTGNFTGSSVYASVGGPSETAPDTGDYWNGNDNATDTLELRVTDLSASEPASGTCTVSIYQTVSDTDVAPAAGGSSVTYDLLVLQGTTTIASRTGITPTDSAFTLDNNLTFAASAITDWSDVRIRFISYGTGGAPAGRRGAAISYMDISAPDADLSLVIDDGLDVDALILTGAVPTALVSLSALVPPGAMHMGTVGLRLWGHTPTVTVAAVGGGNLTIDDGLDPDTLVISGVAPTIGLTKTADPTVDTLVLTGQVPTIGLTKTADPTADTLVLTGQVPTAITSLTVIAGSPDTLLFTGAAPTIGLTKTADPTIDTLVLTGQAPTIGLTKTADPGIDTLVFTGYEPLSLVGKVAHPSIDTLVLTGYAPTIGLTKTADPGIDTLVFTGYEPLSLVGKIASPSIGALFLTGAEPTIGLTKTADPGIDTLILTGAAPTIGLTKTADPSIDTLVLTGAAPTIGLTKTADPSAGSLVLSGAVPLAITPIVVDPTVGSLALTGAIPIVNPTEAVLPQTGQLTLSTSEFSEEFDDSFGLRVRLIVGIAAGSPDALVITGQAPTIGLTKTADPSIDALLLTGAAPTIGLTKTADPSIDTLVLTGAAPTIGITKTADPADGSLVISGAVPLAISPITVEPAAGALVLTGQAPTARTTLIVLPSVDSLTITGAAPSVSWTVAAGAVDALAITGQAPTIGLTKTADPAAGSLVLTGQVPIPVEKDSTEIPSTGSLVLTGTLPLVRVDNVGTLIVNANATTNVPNNYEQCDFSGFRQLPGSLKMTWNKYGVRQKSWEERHPQDLVRGGGDRQRGPRRPEQDDKFIGTDIDAVTGDDL